MQRAAREILSLALLLMAAPEARAGDVAIGTAERDAQARFEEGIARVRAGDFEGAYVSFSMAQAVSHRPPIVWNLALAEEKTHRTLAALAHFKEYWRQTTSADPHRASAFKHIEDINATTGHIDVVAPAGAQLTLDGNAAGVVPVDGPLDVLPGHHVVESHFGGSTRSIAVDVAAGQTVQAALAETNPPEPPHGATEPMGSPETAPPVLPSAEEPQRASLNPAKVITVTAIGGAAVIAAGLGVVFAIRSQSDAKDANNLRGGQGDASCQPSTTGRCASLKNAVDAQSSDTSWAVGWYATAGVLAAGAVATWFLWPNARSARATLVPLTGPSTAGLTLLGTF
jgi:hypothetical protein